MPLFEVISTYGLEYQNVALNKCYKDIKSSRMENNNVYLVKSLKRTYKKSVVAPYSKTIVNQ